MQFIRSRLYKHWRNESLNSELKFLNNKVFSLYEEYTKGKISVKNIRRFNKDRFLNIEEAKDLGIVDFVYWYIYII